MPRLLRLPRLRRPPGTLIVLATLVLASLVGCGGDDRPGGSRLDGESLEVIAYWSGGEQDQFVKVLRLFERDTGARVRYISGGEDLPTLLQTRLRGGNPPNVAITPLPGVVTQLAREDDLKPLNADVLKAVKDNYTQAWQDLGTVDGKPYAVYFKANNKSTFWYNTHVIADNGLEQQLPKTWDEFVALCTSLADLGIPPVAVGAANGWVLSDWFENVYLQAEGPDLYDKLSRHEIPWTDPSVRRTFDTLGQVLGQDIMVEGGRVGALQQSFEDSVLKVFGPLATAAMVYEGDFVSGVIDSNTRAELGRDADFFPFPSIDHPKAVVVGGDAAMALTDDRATMELMEFLASPEAGAEWARAGGFLSPNRNVKLDTYLDGVTKRMAQEMLDASVLRFDMSDLYPARFGATRGTGIWKAMQDFLDEPAEVDKVMRQLEDEADG